MNFFFSNNNGLISVNLRNKLISQRKKAQKIHRPTVFVQRILFERIMVILMIFFQSILGYRDDRDSETIIASQGLISFHNHHPYFLFEVFNVTDVLFNVLQNEHIDSTILLYQKRLMIS